VFPDAPVPRSRCPTLLAHDLIVLSEGGGPTCRGRAWPATDRPKPAACIGRQLPRTASPVDALRQAWASPEAIGFTALALGENAVILAAEVVGYRRHGSVERGSTPL